MSNTSTVSFIWDLLATKQFENLSTAISIFAGIVYIGYKAKIDRKHEEIKSRREHIKKLLEVVYGLDSTLRDISKRIDHSFVYTTSEILNKTQIEVLYSLTEFERRMVDIHRECDFFFSYVLPQGNLPYHKESEAHKSPLVLIRLLISGVYTLLIREADFRCGNIPKEADITEENMGFQNRLQICQADLEKELNITLSYLGSLRNSLKYEYHSTN